MFRNMSSLGKLVAGVVFFVPLSASATTQTSTWQGGGGNSNWNTAANWSPSGVPNNNGITNYTVIIGSPAPTNLNIPTVVDSLTINFTGSLNVMPSIFLTAQDTLTNNGTLNLSTSTGNGCQVYTPGTFTNNGSITVGGTESEFAAQTAFINNGSTTIIGGFDSEIDAGATLTNDGTLASSGENSQIVDDGGTETNNGTIIANGTDNSEIFWAGTLTNLNSGTLTGGTYEVTDGNTIVLPGPVATNAATIILSGPNPIFAAIASLATNSGSFSLLAGNSFTAAGDLANSGSLVIGPAVDVNGPSTLTVNGNYNQTSGLTQVDGVLMLQNSGIFNLSGGTLKGTGTIDGPVVNTGGTVSPGDSPGTLTMDGSYSQDSTSTLNILIAGVSSSGDYSSLISTGAALLAGTLQLTWQPGFSPGNDDTYTILTADGGITGEFATIDSEYPVQVNYLGDEVTVLVPEPSSLALFGSGLVLLRRRTPTRSNASPVRPTQYRA